MSLLLLLFCSFIYYFFYTSRLENIKAHLTNHAITTARMLDESEVFDQTLIKKIDSITLMPMKNKTVQAYNNHNEKIYNYSDRFSDSLQISDDILNKARADSVYFFTAGKREAIVYYYSRNNIQKVIVECNAIGPFVAYVGTVGTGPSIVGVTMAGTKKTVP